MLRAILRRIGFAVLVLVGTAVVVSLALSFVPDGSTDAPVFQRWGDHLHTVFAFSYGGETGIVESRGVSLSKILWEGGTITLTLIGGGVLTILAVGLPLGIGRARRPESRTLQVATSFAHVLSSVPTLVWAFVLLVTAVALFGVAPNHSLLDGAGPGEATLIYAAPIIALALGDGTLSDVIRHVRSETEKELGQTYVRALRARQAPVFRHVWRGIVGPVFSVIANKIAYLMSGTIVVEYVFGFPGLASQIYYSIESTPKGYDVILSATLLFVGVTVLMNVLSEVIALTADPRLRTA